MPTPEKLKPIWRIVQVVQSSYGFTLGVYLFTIGAYFYSHLKALDVPEQTAMLLTATLFMIENALVVLLEIPTGAIGDAIGRKMTLVGSFTAKTLFFLSLIAIHYSSSLTIVFGFGILAMICLSFDHTLYSGSFVAWIIDAIEEHAPDTDPSSILGRKYTYSFYSMFLGAVIGIWALNHSYVFTAYFLCAIFCFSTIIFCLGEMEENQNIDHLDRSTLSISSVAKRMGQIITTSFLVFQKAPQILVVTLVFSATMFLVDITSYSWPIALKANFGLEKHSTPWILLTVLFVFTSAKGSTLFTYFSNKAPNGAEKKSSINRLWIWTLFACSLAVVPVLFSSSYSYFLDQFNVWIFAAAILGVRLCYGAFRPAYDALVNKLIPKEHAGERATILSMGSMARSIMNLLLTIPAIGFSAKTISVSWALPALILAVILLGGHVVMRKYQQQSPSIEEIGERKVHANT